MIDKMMFGQNLVCTKASPHIPLNGLVQERHKSSALAHLSWTNPVNWELTYDLCKYNAILLLLPKMSAYSTHNAKM